MTRPGTAPGTVGGPGRLPAASTAPACARNG